MFPNKNYVYLLKLISLLALVLIGVSCLNFDISKPRESRTRTGVVVVVVVVTLLRSVIHLEHPC